MNKLPVYFLTSDIVPSSGRTGADTPLIPNTSGSRGDTRASDHVQGASTTREVCGQQSTKDYRERLKAGESQAADGQWGMQEKRMKAPT